MLSEHRALWIFRALLFSALNGVLISHLRMNLIWASHKSEWGEQTAPCVGWRNRKQCSKREWKVLLIQISLNLLITSRLPKYLAYHAITVPPFSCSDINLLGGAHNMYLSIFEEFLKNVSTSENWGVWSVLDFTMQSAIFTQSFIKFIRAKKHESK